MKDTARIALLAKRWWENLRPTGWSIKSHIDNPGVNTRSLAERDLAEAIADALRENQA
jgi:hypothetical protein